MSQPSMFLVRNDQYEAQKTEDDDIEGDGAEHGLRDNAVGDMKAYCLEEDMNHELPFCEAMYHTQRMMAQTKMLMRMG
jgi:hypothetical protein